MTALNSDDYVGFPPEIDPVTEGYNENVSVFRDHFYLYKKQWAFFRTNGIGLLETPPPGYSAMVVWVKTPARDFQRLLNSFYASEIPPSRAIDIEVQMAFEDVGTLVSSRTGYVVRFDLDDEVGLPPLMRI